MRRQDCSSLSSIDGFLLGDLVCSTVVLVQVQAARPDSIDTCRVKPVKSVKGNAARLSSYRDPAGSQ